jgi:hypothetical protein
MTVTASRSVATDDPFAALRGRAHAAIARSASLVAEAEDLVVSCRLVRDERALVSRCEWCGRLGVDARHWLLPDELPLSLSPLGVRRNSHGICPDCIERLEAEGRSAQAHAALGPRRQADVVSIASVRARRSWAAAREAISGLRRFSNDVIHIRSEGARLDIETGETLVFLCECGDVNCHAELHMTASEYSRRPRGLLIGH